MCGPLPENKIFKGEYVYKKLKKKLLNFYLKMNNLN
jgi:hypothetical protein